MQQAELTIWSAMPGRVLTIVNGTWAALGAPLWIVACQRTIRPGNESGRWL